MDVETVPSGRRVSDRVAVNAPVRNFSDSWMILAAIILTALIIGGLALVYHQSAMASMRSDYQLEIERLQSQLRAQQLKQEITSPAPTP